MRISATANLPDIDKYILRKHGSPRALTPREVDVIRIQAQAQMRVIRRNWPVRTGASRAAWSFSINPSPNNVSVVFSNTMWYSSFITRKGEKPVKKGGTPWYKTLLKAVWEANKPRLTRLLKEEIDKTEAALAAQTPTIPQIRTQRARTAISLTRSPLVQEALRRIL